MLSIVRNDQPPEKRTWLTRHPAIKVLVIVVSIAVFAFVYALVAGLQVIYG